MQECHQWDSSSLREGCGLQDKGYPLCSWPLFFLFPSSFLLIWRHTTCQSLSLRDQGEDHHRPLSPSYLHLRLGLAPLLFCDPYHLCSSSRGVDTLQRSMVVASTRSNLTLKACGHAHRNKRNVYGALYLRWLCRLRCGWRFSLQCVSAHQRSRSWRLRMFGVLASGRLVWL